MAEEKVPPTTEKSLNSISWHLKQLNEKMERLCNALERASASLRLGGKSVEEDPF